MKSVPQTPNRAVLYARVSTEKQAAQDKTSLLQQITALEKYATDRVYTVVARVAGQEPNDTIDRDARPYLDKVWRMVEAGEVDVVLTQDSDRIVREPYLRGYLNLRFEEHGVKLRALDDAEDDSEYADIINFLKGTQAKAERTKFAERSQRNKEFNASDGKFVLSPPYGFRKEGYALRVDAEQMAHVREIFRVVAETGNMGEAKTVLEGAGVSAPRGGQYWHLSTIRGIIQNDVYSPHTPAELGALVAAGHLRADVAARFDGPVGIQWFNVNRIEKKGGKRIDRGRKDATEHIAIPVPNAGVPIEHIKAARYALSQNIRTQSKGRYTYELRGYLYCECGSKMQTHPVAGERYYYVCGRIKNKMECPAKVPGKLYHNAAELDERVSNFVQSLLHNSNVLSEQLEAQIEAERKRLRDPSREIQDHLKQIKSIDRKMSYFLDLAAEEDWPKEALRTKLYGLQEQRKAAEAEVERLKDASDELAHLEEMAEYARNYYAEDLADLMEYLPQVRETAPIERPESERLVPHLVEPGSHRKRTPEEIEDLRRQAERERSEHRRKVYRNLDLSAVVDREGNLTVKWFGSVCSKKLSRASRPQYRSCHRERATPPPRPPRPRRVPERPGSSEGASCA
jgi:DNA invertase Pin-like site-specific DNA recombinase